MSRPRLLAVGRGPPASGYARVLDSLLGALTGAFEVTLFSVAEYGPPARRDFAVRGNELMGDVYGREQLPGLLRAVDPDVILVHGDANLFSIHADAIGRHRRERPGVRSAVYCPIDWPELPSPVAAALARADAVALYTEFGRDLLRRSLGELGLAEPALDVIPHPVDTTAFAGVPGARRRVLGDRHAGAFVVLNANRNIRRKRLDLTLRGFAEFARDRPDAVLYLHSGPADRGYDLTGLARELGIAERMVVTPHEGRRPRVSDERLNLVYNACDVGLNTADAEGFGLVAFEHAATGAAQVVPDHGPCAELWDGNALLTANEPGAVAAALGRLYDDPALRAD
ncbi:MAG TPA: glycosyltransferase, partial [Thermoleophilaceae bacterium]|nr:glycosyltransferase [Thermoleophilaceae bacterium]